MTDDEIKSFGWEVEFPIVIRSEFIAWNSILDRLARKFKTEYPNARLYRDATPCAEWASTPHIDYNKIFEEHINVFTEIMEKLPNGVFFSGGAPQIDSTFSGHIHIGNPKGWSTKRIKAVCDALHGSQSFMELISQNFRSRNHADERACRRDYYHYYPITEKQDSRQYLNYTYNEFKTVENRIPPCSDFHHLLTLTLIEIAWAKKFDGSMSYDLKENWQEAIQKGPLGNYYLMYGDELFVVDYSTYVSFQLLRIQELLEAEVEKLDNSLKKEVCRYLEFLKRTPLATILAGKTIVEAQEMGYNMVFKKESFIKNVQIAKIKPPKGKFDEKSIGKVISRINASSDLKKFERFKGFIEGIKRQDKSLVAPEDLDILEKVLAKKKIETVI